LREKSLASSEKGSRGEIELSKGDSYGGNEKRKPTRKSSTDFKRKEESGNPGKNEKGGSRTRVDE